MTIEKRRPPTSIDHGFSLTDSSVYLREKLRGDERTRTADLLITSLIPLIPARTALSGNCAYLQVFLKTLSDGLSVAYRPVPAGLRYGCGKLLSLYLRPSARSRYTMNATMPSAEL
jgi:hypothetical protein